MPCHELSLFEKGCREFHEFSRMLCVGKGLPEIKKIFTNYDLFNPLIFGKKNAG
ncbi:hypothetical protein BSF42_26090 [Flavobacterium sp. ACN6]|nr:hypothetical protein BSF42_26090 [Flavobacterium sp. ACN6]